MTKLNYDLIPEELMREAINYFVDAALSDTPLTIFTAYSDEAIELGKEILASQQTKKPVDMSVLVNSGVLCEFSQNTQFVFASKGFLSSIKNDRYNAAEWKYCRPLYGHWHSALNNNNPIQLIKDLEYAGFEVETYQDGFGTIMHFCIIRIKESYCMPL